MAEFEHHAAPFDLSLSALGRTPATRDIYVGVLRRFDRFIGEIAVDQVVPGQLVEYQRHLASVGLSWSRFNINTCALRSFYRDYLGRREWDYTRIPFQKRGRRLPQIPSAEDVSGGQETRESDV